MRRGFALLGVVLIMAGAAAVALASATLTRQAILSTHNRTSMLRNAWQAEDCVARSIAVLDRALGAPDELGRRGPRVPADSLPRVLAGTRLIAECPGDVTLRPAGLALPLNTIPSSALRSFLRLTGADAATADSLADAILDWRDTDTIPRARGCEKACYAAAHRVPPRDGPFAHVDELEDVRGFARMDALVRERSGRSLGAFLSVEPDRVVVTHAPLVVLASLPGVGVAGAERIARRRADGDWKPRGLQEIGALLDVPSADSLLRAIPDLSSIATVEPEVWVLHVISPRRVAPSVPTPNEQQLRLRLRFVADEAQLVSRSSAP